MDSGDRTRASDALPWLWGGRIQRIDSPWPEAFLLTLFGAGRRNTLLLSLSARNRGLGALDDRPRGAPATDFVRRLRKQLEGARVVAARWHLTPEPAGQAIALELHAARGDVVQSLFVDFGARAPDLVLTDREGSVHARYRAAPSAEPGPYRPTGTRAITPVLDDEQLRSAGARLLAATQDQGEAAVRAQLRSQAKTILKRAARKAGAIRADLARAQQAPVLREEANLLLCRLDQIPKGQRQVTLTDLDGAARTIQLDPAQDANANVQSRFARARKLERGAGIARDRLADAEAEVERVTCFLDALDDAPLSQLERDADELGLRGAIRLQPSASAPRRRHATPTHVCYRTFVAAQGRLVLVGKGAEDNDALTLTVARPHDHWLHARGVQGAHVVIPCDRGAVPSNDLLLDAAHLAAHFSDCRGEALAEIQHTERRYVRKPKGFPKGAVRLEREKVLLLRVSEARLKQLLANERRTL